MITIFTEDIKSTLSSEPSDVKLGQPVTLRCSTLALTPESFTFYKGHEQLQSGPGNTFNISKFTPRLIDRYRCVVKCDDGARSRADWFMLNTTGII